MMNPPLLPMFQMTSTSNDAVGLAHMVDLAAAKLSDLYGGGGNVPRLDGPEKFCRALKGYVHDTGSSSPAITATMARQTIVFMAMISSQVRVTTCLVLAMSEVALRDSWRNGDSNPWFSDHSRTPRTVGGFNLGMGSLARGHRTGSVWCSSRS